MKKISKIVLSMVMCVVMAISCNAAYAYDGENFDNDYNISPGLLITNGVGTVSVNSSITGYSLYYQSIEISDAKYSEITKKREEYESKEKTFKEDLDSKDAEIKRLKEAASAIEDKESEEYKEAEKAYADAIDDYNNTRDGYIEQLTAIEKEFYATWPDYNDSNWIKVGDDGKFKVCEVNYTGKKNYFVWFKLVKSDESVVYDAVYTIQDGKKEVSTDQLISTNQDDFSLNIGESKDIDVTVTPEGTAVTWKSDNESIATVENGKVTAKGEGTATITATTEDGKSSISVKVTCIDNTKSDKRISNTGVSCIQLVLMVGVSVIAIALYKKSKSIKIK